MILKKNLYPHQETKNTGNVINEDKNKIIFFLFSIVLKDKLLTKQK